MPAYYDRTVEPCHRQVRPPVCTDSPVPFDEHLHIVNRESDTVELQSIPAEHVAATNPVEPEHTPTKIDPVKIHEEVTREIQISYEIPSELMTGRLIDMLL